MNTSKLKRLFVAVMTVMLPAIASATSATLSIEEFTIKAGETKEMLIDLNNPNDEITLVQFDMILPIGLSITMEDGEMAIDIAGRTTWKKHSLNANTLATGETRFLLNSSSNAVISGNSGAIISIKLTAASGFSGGDVKLVEQLLVTPSAAETKPADYTYTIAPKDDVALAITFADASVKAICVENWDTDGDGELSKDEAAAVKSLGSVFKGNKEITSFEELQYFTGLTTIDNGAFQGCTGLEKVTLPENTTEIGTTAFALTAIKGLYLRDGLETIRQQAFYGCEKLIGINIPATVSSIEKEVFVRCFALTTLTVDPDNPYYDGRDECNAIIETETNTLIAGGYCATVPASVKHIGDAAMAYCWSTDLVLPEGLETIGENAFWNSSRMESLTIPSTVTKIGDNAFEDCNNLKTVTSNLKSPFAISDNVFGESAYNGTLNVPYGTKQNYQTVDGWKNFTIIVEQELKDGDTFTSLSSEGVEIVFTVLSVKDKTVQVGPNNSGKTFMNATAAIDKNTTGTLTIPSSVNGFAVTTIGDFAFQNCNISNVVIPEGIKRIGQWAFNRCPITSITLPSTLTFIGQYAFGRDWNTNGTELQEVYCNVKEPFSLMEKALCWHRWIVSGSNEEFYTYSGKLYVPKGTKQKYLNTPTWDWFGDNIVEVDDPNDSRRCYAVYADGTLTFYYDNEKDSRSGNIYAEWLFPNTSKDAWLEYKSELKTVTFDKSMADYVGLVKCSLWFYGCANLAEIIGLENLRTDNVTTMSQMFSGCKKLTSLDVSHFSIKSLKYMGFMFENCTSLKDLKLGGSASPNLTEIRGLVSRCSSLESIDLGKVTTDNVDDMYMAFLNCSSLKVIDLTNFNSANVTFMASMFNGCSSIETIYVSDGWSTESVEERDFQAIFQGCTKLVGGAGTKFDADFYKESQNDLIYARIDGGASNPGYLTYIPGSSSSAKCDVNHDGFVTAEDVEAIADMIDRGIYNAAADVNGDGKVNVTDIVMVVNLIKAAQ